MFLTEKRDGTIKAHACVDRHKQMKHIESIQTVSSAVMELIFIMAATDAKNRGIWQLWIYLVHFDTQTLMKP